ncbi:MAG: hypothetical protein RLN62_05450 [Rickettsiales bacterium]
MTKKESDKEQTEAMHEDLSSYSQLEAQSRAASQAELSLSYTLSSDELTLEPIAIASNALIRRSALAAANTASGGVIGALGLTYAIQRMYINYRYITDARIFADEILENVAPVEVDNTVKLLTAQGVLKESKTDEEDEQNKAEAIKYIISQNMSGTILQNTISPGLAGSALMGSIFVFASLIFPPVTAPLFFVGIGILAAGTIATFGAAIKNRQLLQSKLKTTFDGDSGFIKRLRSKAKTISKTIPDTKFKEARKARNTLEWISSRMLDLIAATKISSFFNFISLSTRIAVGVAQNIVLIGSASLDAASNYLGRREKYLKFSKILSESFIPKIHARRFLIFGKTKYEKFVEKHRSKIIDRLGYSHSIPMDKLLERIKYEHPKLYDQLQMECVKDGIHRKYLKFCQKESLDAQSSKAFNDFSDHQVQKSVAADVRTTGYISGISILISITSIAIVFPPAAIPLFALAAIGAFVVPAVTEYITKKESEKFSEKLKKISSSKIKEVTGSKKAKEADIADNNALTLLAEIKSVAQQSKIVSESSANPTVKEPTPTRKAPIVTAKEPGRARHRKKKRHSPRKGFARRVKRSKSEEILRS